MVPSAPVKFFTSQRMLPVARKDDLPTTQESSVIYEHKCHSDSRYVGRTSQRLQDRIKQHVPQWLRPQLTRGRQSQRHRSCKRNDTKRHQLYQSTAASTWWCGPRPRLGWVEMSVGLPEGPRYPRHSPLFFRYAAP